MRKHVVILGIIAIILVQGSIFPTNYKIISGETLIDFPPLSMMILLNVGMLLFFIHSLITKNKIHSLSFGSGFILQAHVFITYMVL